MYQLWRHIVYPCASAHVFFLRATLAGRAFSQGMPANPTPNPNPNPNPSPSPNPIPNPSEGMHEYVRDRPNEWGRAFQLIVMRYTVGVGDDLPPLRFRLLPTSLAVNLPQYRQRQRSGLPTAATVAVHAGQLKSEEAKVDAFRGLGFLERGLTAWQDMQAEATVLRDARPRSAMRGGPGKHLFLGD